MNAVTEARPHFDTDEARWAALISRDAAAATSFLYGVASTGVYCRPGCPSRLPKRERTRFFINAEHAQLQGYRACKRCSPDVAVPSSPAVEAVAQACEMIDRADVSPSLETLAAATGYSPSHFHRMFKDTLGVTPKEYASAGRLERVRDNLHKGSSVTNAMYAAGFGSSSRFYNAAGSLGMKPSEYRAGAAGVEIRYSVGECSLGFLLVAESDKGVCSIEFGETEDELRVRLHERFPNANVREGDVEASARARLVSKLVESPSRGLDLPLDVRGTAFQIRVWKALQTIPPGATATYSEVAERIGSPNAARAVAGACAANNLAVAVPCHRVVRADGEPGGYRWGVARKAALLQREAAAILDAGRR